MTFRGITPTLWMAEAFKHLGLREIPGKQNNPTIVRWVKELKGWWNEDETPWCGTFVAHCLQAAGMPTPKDWYRAKSYADYGVSCIKTEAPFGAIGVKSRKGGGHVFFIVARDISGNILYGLGGNQSNMVNIVPFHLSEIDAVRWIPQVANRVPLPVVKPGDIQVANRGSES